MRVLSNLTAPLGQAPAKPTKTVTGQYLAKATSAYPPWSRALDAARWLRGELQIKPPTVKLAAKTFGVSVPLVAEARQYIGFCVSRRLNQTNNNGGTTALSDDAVERIVVELGPDRILRALDRVTQPPLPLVAAE